MMELFCIILTTVATIFAAIAAWKASTIAQDSFDFQKDLIIKQSTILQLLSTVKDLRDLSDDLSNIGGLDDTDLTELESRFDRSKKELRRLSKSLKAYNELNVFFTITSFHALLTQIKEGTEFMNNGISALEENAQKWFIEKNVKTSILKPIVKDRIVGFIERLSKNSANQSINSD